MPDAGGQPGCADPSELYPDVFQAEIMPVLTGEVDLDPDPSMSNVGCTRFECHGRVRGPESLFLDPNDTAENNLGRFMCFVDLADPAASQALLCPLGDPGCFSFPHPGADIFLGEDDRNYQHILAYLLLIAPAPADAEGDL